MWIIFILLSTIVYHCNGFSVTASGKHVIRNGLKTKSSTNILLHASSGSIEALNQGQKISIQEITSSIPSLVVRSDLSRDISVDGSIGQITGYEAPGADGNVAWMASVYIPNKLSSLTIFNGPLTNVPHLVSKCCTMNDSNMISLIIDFRPRGYGAYEKRDSNGNYPGPEQLGRSAFEYSGNRMEYDTKFGTIDVINWMQSVVSNLQGSVPSNQQLSEEDVLTRGPLIIDIVVPITESNINTIVNARIQAAKYWLSWATSNQYNHRPGAPINSQYVYDTKYKQNSYNSLLKYYTEIFGPTDGLLIASTESGPLDEAYVGGGS